AAARRPGPRTSRPRPAARSRATRLGSERGAQILEDRRRRADAEPRAEVVVLLGEHGGPLVDLVHEALRGPRHDELGLLERAREVGDEPLAQREDVAAVPGRELERARVAVRERGAARGVDA